MRSVGGNIIAPNGITTASLKGLWVPNWETGQVANAGCSQLTDWSGNGFHLTQATGSLQPLFKKDTLFGGKWYIKGDGVDDFMANASDILTTGNGQIMVIGRVRNGGFGIFQSPKLVLSMSSGIALRTNSSTAGSGQIGGYGVAQALAVGAPGYFFSGINQLGMMFGRKTATSTIATINNVVSSIGTNGDALPTAGTGIRILNSTTLFTSTYWDSEIVCIALWEGTDLTANDLSGLLNWSRTEFEVYRDLLSNKT